MSLCQPMLTLQALRQRGRDLSLHMQRLACLILALTRSRPPDETGVGLRRLEIAFTEVQKPASQKRGKGVVLLIARPQQVRDGPIRSRARPDAPFRDVGRQAA
jgi:hypothetical protein